MNNKLGRQLITFLGLLVIYGIAIGLDRWMEYTRQLSARYFIPLLPIWSLSFLNIILALCVFSFYRWAMPNLARWAIWFIIILGLLIDFVPIFYTSGLLQPLVAVHFFSTALSSSLTWGSYFIMAGALTAIAGIFTLFRTRE